VSTETAAGRFECGAIQDRALTDVAQAGQPLAQSEVFWVQGLNGSFHGKDFTIECRACPHIGEPDAPTRFRNQTGSGSVSEVPF